MVFIIWWWRIQNDSCKNQWQNEAKSNKIAFYIPTNLDPERRWLGFRAHQVAQKSGNLEKMTTWQQEFFPHLVEDEESKWSSWSNQIWGRFLLKKPTFCQFIAEICDTILRPLIQKPLKSEETETCQMLLDNCGISWMSEKGISNVKSKLLLTTLPLCWFQDSIISKQSVWIFSSNAPGDWP